MLTSRTSFCGSSKRSGSFPFAWRTRGRTSNRVPFPFHPSRWQIWKENNQSKFSCARYCNIFAALDNLKKHAKQMLFFLFACVALGTRNVNVRCCGFRLGNPARTFAILGNNIVTKKDLPWKEDLQFKDWWKKSWRLALFEVLLDKSSRAAKQVQIENEDLKLKRPMLFPNEENHCNRYVL